MKKPEHIAVFAVASSILSVVAMVVRAESPSAITLAEKPSTHGICVRAKAPYEQFEDVADRLIGYARERGLTHIGMPFLVPEGTPVLAQGQTENPEWEACVAAEVTDEPGGEFHYREIPAHKVAVALCAHGADESCLGSLGAWIAENGMAEVGTFQEYPLSNLRQVQDPLPDVNRLVELTSLPIYPLHAMWAPESEGDAGDAGSELAPIPRRLFGSHGEPQPAPVPQPGMLVLIPVGDVARGNSKS